MYPQTYQRNCIQPNSVKWRDNPAKYTLGKTGGLVVETRQPGTILASGIRVEPKGLGTLEFAYLLDTGYPTAIGLPTVTSAGLFSTFLKTSQY